MYLFHLTLQRASGITHSIHGNFSGAKLQEIIVARGKSLELLKPDPNTGKVHTMLTAEVFGVIRSLMAFRLPGGTSFINVFKQIFRGRIKMIFFCWFRFSKPCFM